MLQGLPYGTMSDDEMRAMGIAQLQDDGVIFMWVTGALKVGRSATAALCQAVRIVQAVCGSAPAHMVCPPIRPCAGARA